ncbi:MAG TPA: alkaline phosphatase family protein, partial [Phycisphaerales bacterium]|nr:alkaline phosphatase family protein [Phycisphaerales bacterium]
MNSRTMSLLFASLVLAAIALPAWQAVSSPPAVTRQAPALEVDAAGRATVVWISVDGVRPDYLERGELPFLSKLMREGAVSRQLVPVFPSLTFPSHVSQATGVTAEKHGVTANSFIDKTDWRNHRYP